MASPQRTSRRLTGGTCRWIYSPSSGLRAAHTSVVLKDGVLRGRAFGGRVLATLIASHADVVSGSDSRASTRLPTLATFVEPQKESGVGEVWVGGS